MSLLTKGPLPVTASLVLNPLMAKMTEAAGFAAIEIEAQLVPTIDIEKLLAVEGATVEK